MLLLDPNKYFMLKNGNPYFRAWKGEQKLRHHPLKQCAVPATLRGDIYTSAGIRPGELNSKVGSNLTWAGIRASVILGGPFKLALTNDPSLHLRFTDNKTPTLLVLDSRTMSMLSLLHLTGLTAYVSYVLKINLVQSICLRF
jgi:hypothetical protein